MIRSNNPRYKDMDDAYDHEQWVEAGKPTKPIDRDGDSPPDDYYEGDVSNTYKN